MLSSFFAMGISGAWFALRGTGDRVVEGADSVVAEFIAPALHKLPLPFPLSRQTCPYSNIMQSM